MTDTLAQEPPARERAGVVGPVVEAFVETMRPLMAALGPGGGSVRTHGALLHASRLPVPRFNGALLLDADADLGAVVTWLDRLQDDGVPFAITCRPDQPVWLPELAERYGLGDVDQQPLMVRTGLGDTGRTGRTAAPGQDGGRDGRRADTTADLRIHPVDPASASDVDTAQVVMSDGFEAPRTILDPLMAARALELPGVTGYVGRVDGEPAVVGLGARFGEVIGVFNIATVPAHRRHGLGAAMTRHVVSQAASAGARTAYLQSSPMGFGVYQRLGFRHVETWSVHLPPE